MKNIALTITFLIFFSLFVFYLLIDSKKGFNKQNKLLEVNNEAQEYCTYKNGQIRNINGTDFCISDGKQENADEFFIRSLKEEVDSTEISIEKI